MWNHDLTDFALQPACGESWTAAAGAAWISCFQHSHQHEHHSFGCRKKLSLSYRLKSSGTGFCCSAVTPCVISSCSFFRDYTVKYMGAKKINFVFSTCSVKLMQLKNSTLSFYFYLFRLAIFWPEKIIRTDFDYAYVSVETWQISKFPSMHYSHIYCTLF